VRNGCDCLKQHPLDLKQGENLMQAKIQAILQSWEILGKEPRVYMQGYDIPELSARLFPVKTQNGLYLAVWSGEEKNVFERPSLVWREKDEVCEVYPFSFSNYLRLTRFLAHPSPLLWLWGSVGDGFGGAP